MVVFLFCFFLRACRTNPVLNVDFNTTPYPVLRKNSDADTDRSVKSQPDMQVLISLPSQEWLWLSGKLFVPECVLWSHALSIVNDLSLIKWLKKTKPCAFCFRLKHKLQRIGPKYGHRNFGNQIQICKFTLSTFSCSIVFLFFIVPDWTSFLLPGWGEWRW